MDSLARDVRRLPREQLVEFMDRNPQEFGIGRIKTFKDLDPEQPLKWAVYSERFARELIEGTGWTPLELSQPDGPSNSVAYIQHHFVCAPD